MRTYIRSVLRGVRGSEPDPSYLLANVPADIVCRMFVSGRIVIRCPDERKMRTIYPRSGGIFLMNETISIFSIICIFISCIVGFALPITLLWYCRKYLKADVKAFFVGVAVYIIFSLLLEDMVNRFVFSTSVGQEIFNNNLIFACYAGLAAALFEGTGRLLAFLFILRPGRNKDVNALMYSAGHGGIESITVLSLSMINNLMWSYYIVTGKFDMLSAGINKDSVVAVEEMIRSIIDTPAYVFLLGGVERIFAVALQISLSVLVWFAVKKKKAALFAAAFLIHFLGDFASIYLIDKMPSELVEVCLGAMSGAAVLFAIWVWKRYTRDAAQ